jgi:hypothetical protein
VQMDWDIPAVAEAPVRLGPRREVRRPHQLREERGLGGYSLDLPVLPIHIVGLGGGGGEHHVVQHAHGGRLAVNEVASCGVRRKRGQIVGFDKRVEIGERGVCRGLISVCIEYGIWYRDSGFYIVGFIGIHKHIHTYTHTYTYPGSPPRPCASPRPSTPAHPAARTLSCPRSPGTTPHPRTLGPPQVRREFHHHLNHFLEFRL